MIAWCKNKHRRGKIMANARQLATSDEEALAPKRVKKKKPKNPVATKYIRFIEQEIQKITTHVNAFKKALGKNSMLPVILHKCFTDTGLPFMDPRSLFAYSATSKHAYISAHEHPITKHTFIFASAQRHLKQVQMLIEKIDKKADTAIDITSNHSHSMQAFIAMIAIGFIVGGIPPVITLLLCLKFMNEDKMSLPASVGAIFGTLVLSIFMVLIIGLKAYPVLNHYFEGIKKSNEEELNLLNQLSELLEKNDGEALEEICHEHLQSLSSSEIKTKLTLFTPAKKAKMVIATDEETLLLRK